MLQAGLEPGTKQQCSPIEIERDISVLDHSGTTAGFLLAFFAIKSYLKYNN